VEESPILSVPVMATDNWMREPIAVSSEPLAVKTSPEVVKAIEPVMAEPVVEETVPEPPAPRFMSEDEEMDRSPEAEEPVNVAEPVAAAPSHSFEDFFAEQSPARPKFAELCEEPAYTPLPRDYATDLGNGVRPAAEPVGALFAEKADEDDRDLEVPAFMRRIQF
jgi:cell division protein FtsZ